MVKFNAISGVLFFLSAVLGIVGLVKGPVLLFFLGIIALIIGVVYLFADGGIGGGGGVDDCGGLPLDVCYCCEQPDGEIVYDCDPNCLSSATNSVQVDKKVCTERAAQGEVSANCRQIVN